MDLPKRHAHPSGRREQFMVSFPDGLRDTIKELAESNERTMNAEIVVALKTYVREKTEKADVQA